MWCKKKIRKEKHENDILLDSNDLDKWKVMNKNSRILAVFNDIACLHCWCTQKAAARAQAWNVHSEPVYDSEILLGVINRLFHQEDICF